MRAMRYIRENGLTDSSEGRVWSRDVLLRSYHLSRDLDDLSEDQEDPGATYYARRLRQCNGCGVPMSVVRPGSETGRCQTTVITGLVVALQ